MKAILAIASLILWSGSVHAQWSVPDAASVRSVSGQFVVYGGRLDPGITPPPALITNTNLVELEPSLVAISCERIKEALNTALDLKERRAGKIHITLNPVVGENDPITIVAERFLSGWSYRLELPHFVKRDRFLQAIVQTLLQERADHAGAARSAEIPLWLTEGMTRYLRDSRLGELVLDNPRVNWRGLDLGPVVIEERRRDPLDSARQYLRENPPLSLEDLCWPDTETLSGREGGEIFGCSAQLFVTELLHLKRGRESFGRMLDELAGCYNWQTAFFRAFENHFTRQLDLEKWWELQLAHFTGRDPSQLWTAEESRRKLDEMLHTRVEIRRATNELPVYAEVPLQAVIREWDSLRQGPVLNQKLRELELARLRVAPPYVGLVEQYHQLLSDYVRHRDQAGLVLPVAKFSQPRPRPLVRETLKKLEELDALRAAIAPSPEPSGPNPRELVTPLTLQDTRIPPPTLRTP